MSKPSRQLQQLAVACGIQTAYDDVNHHRRIASAETLAGVLAAWGCPVETEKDIEAALANRRQAETARTLPWVLVAWDGELPHIPLLRPPRDSQRIRLLWRRESGETSSQDVAWEPTRDPVVELGRSARRPGGSVTGCVEKLPWGYHQLSIEGEDARPAMIISAPRASFHPPGNRRNWGLFAPLYAIHSKSSWGGGNFTDLEHLWEWVLKRGGKFVATLPLTAAFLDEPFEFSPYAPASRLFWNEFFVDVERAVNELGCEASRRLIDAPATQNLLRELRQRPLVDYRRQMGLARKTLEQLAETFFATAGPRRGELEEFVTSRPELDDYARFRAVTQQEGKTWSHWPTRQRDGDLRSGDFDEQVRRYHVFVQWIAQLQMQSLIAKAGASGDGLYLDMPLGVHHQGYDTWRNRDVFALTAAGGAPPDSFFTKGQNWGFPPLHPERLRQHGYGYWIAALRHQLKHAGMLRIDHIMQLHRLYWVPAGVDAREGAYVRYPAEELHAILCLESQRHQCVLVGENLGTVPEKVNADMRRHRIDEIYVLQYKAPSEPDGKLSPVPRRSIASMNTHDMPLFAAFWQVEDLGQLYELGLFSDEELAEQRQFRDAVRRNLRRILEKAGLIAEGEENVARILDALHQLLAQSLAESVLINLEDLWLETQPQNTPGTSHERANWQRKLLWSLEQIVASNDVADRLQSFNQGRRGC